MNLVSGLSYNSKNKLTVAGGLVDTALGTDCAGSVRLPASYCGVFGMRPTHGAIPADGVIPFAPSFDTVGWFARDAQTLYNVGDVILNDADTASRRARLLIADDCFELVDPAVRDALQPAVRSLQSQFATTEHIRVDAIALERWMQCFRVIQGWEIWQNLGAWIEQYKPDLGPGIAERVDAAAQITAAEVDQARALRAQLHQSLSSRVLPGDVLCLPGSPRIAPLKGTATSTVEVTYRYQAICLLSIAGLCGWPEISLPLATLDGCPIGLSIVAPAGEDRQLLQLACELTG